MTSYCDFLNAFQVSGNMSDAIPNLQHKFPELTEVQARYILMQWIAHRYNYSKFLREEPWNIKDKTTFVKWDIHSRLGISTTITIPRHSVGLYGWWYAMPTHTIPSVLKSEIS